MRSDSAPPHSSSTPASDTHPPAPSRPLTRQQRRAADRAAAKMKRKTGAIAATVVGNDICTLHDGHGLAPRVFSAMNAQGIAFIRETTLSLAAAATASAPHLRALGLDRALTHTLPAVLFDAAVAEGQDPYAELRASHLTGRAAPDPVFHATIAYAGNAYGLVDRVGRILTVDEVGVPLLTDALRTIGPQYGIVVHPDAVELSTLAQFTLAALVHGAQRVHRRHPDAVGASVRSWIDSGRVLTMFDPRGVARS